MINSYGILQFYPQVAGLDYKISSGKEATRVPGIGKKIGEKIDEFLATGKLKKIERIENDEVALYQ